MKTPAQRRANAYAAYRLLMLGLYLGLVWVNGATLWSLTCWTVTAVFLWPWRPDWRL